MKARGHVSKNLVPLALETSVVAKPKVLKVGHGQNRQNRRRGNNKYAGSIPNERNGGGYSGPVKTFHGSKRFHGNKNWRPSTVRQGSAGFWNRVRGGDWASTVAKNNSYARDGGVSPLNINGERGKTWTNQSKKICAGWGFVKGGDIKE